MSTTMTENDGGIDSRTPTTFLLNRDQDDEPAVVFVEQFVNRYDDVRVVVETPAPWDTPDDITPANDLVKSLEWDDHHYTFEKEHRLTGHNNVWIVDESGVNPLTEAALSAGYKIVDATDSDEDPNAPDGAFLDACRFAERGDHAVLRYESKQTGDIKTKEGAVTTVEHRADTMTPGIVIQRDDDKYNKLVSDDGTTVVRSTSQYPYMGDAVSVEIVPNEGDSEELEWERNGSAWS